MVNVDVLLLYLLSSFYYYYILLLFIFVVNTERGPDIVRMPSMGQKRTISGMRTISEGHKIHMVVMLFITP